MSRKEEFAEGDSASISLPVPVRDTDLFKHKATSDVLLFLTNHRLSAYSISEIATQIGHAEPSTRRAIEVLVANNLVTESTTGNRRLIQINRDQLQIPDDPLLRIPQPEYHKPVDAAVEELTTRLEDLVGIILYGSVARGEADRRSDIDLWVLTRDSRASTQRTANAVARDLEDQSFNTQRYEYDIDVETIQGIPTYTDNIQEIIVSGIPVYTTTDFQTVKRLLLDITDY